MQTSSPCVPSRIKTKHVFINCPFDSKFLPIRDAILFAICALDFQPRCALEQDDSGQNRLDKIYTIIEECQFGIHDLSAVELDLVTKLPRFNMPFELGLFLACKRFGAEAQHTKRALVLDSDLYRYRQFLSDISGQDIRAHQNEPSTAIRAVRDWLQGASRKKDLPGAARVISLYQSYCDELPEMCQLAGFEADRLTYIDTVNLMQKWLVAGGSVR